MKETQEQMDATLAELRERMSPKTYEVFHRRFLDRQSAREAAAALGMTAKGVQRRYDRATRQWHFLTKEPACPPPVKHLPICGWASARILKFAATFQEFEGHFRSSAPVYLIEGQRIDPNESPLKG